MNGAIILCSSTTITDSSTTEVKGWTGGRAALAVTATAYPTNLHLQYRGWATGGWIRAHTSNISANALVSLDAPAGEYRMQISGSTAVGLSAVLVGIPY